MLVADHGMVRTHSSGRRGHPEHAAPKTFGGDRPVNLQVPSTLAAGKRYPLVLILHGFGANGFLQEAYFGMSSLANDSTAFVLAPDGTENSMGQRDQARSGPGARSRGQARGQRDPYRGHGRVPGGVAVEFWTVEGGGHIPSFTSAFEPAVWQLLTDHRRP